MNPTERRLDECQHIIGYYFSSPLLLETALTHSSLRTPDRECNERLEFLGDSVLGLVITEELYHLLPDQSEGELTRIKSAVVSRSALLSTSQRLGLQAFAEFARGVGKRDKLPASVVANLVEAIIGAIYLDAGYYPAREFVLRHMGGAIDDELNDRGAKNYKSLLQHEVQQSVGVTPTYRTIDADGPDHAKEFVVAAIIRGQEWGQANGPTKKDAEQDAARLALEAWERRGRGRRRRRKRKGDDALEVGDSEAFDAPDQAEDVVDAPEDAPAEVAEAAPAPVEEPARAVRASAPEASSDEDAEPEAPRRRRKKRARRRRTSPGADAGSVIHVESAAEEPAPLPAPASPAPQPEPAAARSETEGSETEGSETEGRERSPRRSRRRSRRAPRSAEASSSEPAAPVAPSAPEPVAPSAPEPVAQPEPEPQPEPQAAEEVRAPRKPRTRRGRASRAAPRPEAPAPAAQPEVQPKPAPKPAPKAAKPAPKAAKPAPKAAKPAPKAAKSQSAPSAFGAGIAEPKPKPKAPAAPARKRAARPERAPRAKAQAEPKAELKPAPKPKPARRPATPSAFGSGIEVPSGGAKGAGVSKPRVAKTAKVKAPARKAAPAPSKPRRKEADKAEGGFGAGI